MFKKSTRCHKKDRARNEELRKALGQEALIEVVKEKHRKWKTKLEQMRDNRLVMIVHEEEAKGKRLRRRPRKRWCENFSIIDE